MHCSRHEFDRAVDLCAMCGEPFCLACLVYPRGRRRPGLCKSCAIAAAGVRASAAPPATISRRDFRQRRRSFLAQERQPDTLAQALGQPEPADPVDELERAVAERSVEPFS